MRQAYFRVCRARRAHRGGREESGDRVIGPSADLSSIKIEVADRLAGVGRFFGLLEGFPELLLQQFGGVFLRFDRLAKDGVAPAVLLLHGAGGLFHILERFWLDGSHVRDDGTGGGVDLQHRAAAGTGYIETGLTLGHRRIIPQTEDRRRGYRGSKRMGKTWKV